MIKHLKGEQRLDCCGLWPQALSTCPYSCVAIVTKRTEIIVFIFLIYDGDKKKKRRKLFIDKWGKILQNVYSQDSGTVDDVMHI